MSSSRLSYAKPKLYDGKRHVIHAHKDVYLTSPGIERVVDREIRVARRYRPKYIFALGNLVLNLREAMRWESRGYDTVGLAVSLRSNDYLCSLRDGKELRELTSYFIARDVTEHLERTGRVELLKGYRGYGQHKGRRTGLFRADECDAWLEEMAQDSVVRDLRQRALVIVRDKDGNDIPFAETDETRFWRHCMQRIGELNNAQTFIPDDVEQLPYFLGRDLYTCDRIFNNGSFDFGGRFYSLIQHLRSADRHKLIMAGEPVVELDFKSFHPTMLYHIEGLVPPAELYDVPDLPNLRGHEVGYDDVKLVVHTAINAASRTKACQAVFLADGFLPNVPGYQRRQKDVAWPFVLDCVSRIENHLEPIKKYLNSGIGLKLQRTDSEISLAVMSHFTSQGVPCIGVHDSFVVPASKEEELREVMTAEYMEAVSKLGSTPRSLPGIDKK